MFKKFIVASVIVGAIFASYVFAAKSYPVALEQGTVIKVVDGDTIKVSLDTGLKVNVRVLGVDTPEKYKLKTSYIECYGKEASAFVTSTLKPGTKVTLETDSISPAIDRYKRPLRHVYIS